MPQASNAQPFIGSKGWFKRFKRCANLHSISLQGELASANQEEATKFKSMIVKEGGYIPQQVFNVNEMGLYWKKIPNRAFISKEEKLMPGHKVAKDQFTLLLGGNS
jgi:hypothetical protein